MTAEEYVLKECRHLPMAIHLDIAKAFQAGKADSDYEQRLKIIQLQDIIENNQRYYDRFMSGQPKLG